MPDCPQCKDFRPAFKEVVRNYTDNDHLPYEVTFFTMDGTLNDAETTGVVKSFPTAFYFRKNTKLPLLLGDGNDDKSLAPIEIDHDDLLPTNTLHEIIWKQVHITKALVDMESVPNPVDA